MPQPPLTSVSNPQPEPAVNGRPPLHIAEGPPAPVFLVGALRSGTTMLRLMLDSHSQLRVPFEFDFAVDSIQDDGRHPNVQQYLEHLTSHRIFLAAGLESNPNLSYPELVTSYLEQARLRAEKPRVGATVHRHFEHLPDLWPNARYLHLVRDGRDVARSVIRMGWAGNAYVAADVWLEAERAWDKLCAKVPAERRFEVRYEELVQDPETVLQNVCNFLDLSFEPVMLEYADRTTYSPPSPTAAAGWDRDEEARREARLAESKLGPMLQARGYALSSSSGGPVSARQVSAHKDALLRLDSRLRVLVFRTKRMGPQLVAMDMATRRLPVPRQLRHAVQHQINQVELKHLK